MDVDTEGESVTVPPDCVADVEAEALPDAVSETEALVDELAVVDCVVDWVCDVLGLADKLIVDDSVFEMDAEGVTVPPVAVVVALAEADKEAEAVSETLGEVLAEAEMDSVVLSDAVGDLVDVIVTPEGVVEGARVSVVVWTSDAVVDRETVEVADTVAVDDVLKVCVLRVLLSVFECDVVVVCVVVCPLFVAVAGIVPEAEIFIDTVLGSVAVTGGGRLEEIEYDSDMVNDWVNEGPDGDAVVEVDAERETLTEFDCVVDGDCVAEDDGESVTDTVDVDVSPEILAVVDLETEELPVDEPEVEREMLVVAVFAMVVVAVVASDAVGVTISVCVIEVVIEALWVFAEAVAEIAEVLDGETDAVTEMEGVVVGAVLTVTVSGSVPEVDFDCESAVAVSEADRVVEADVLSEEDRDTDCD